MEAIARQGLRPLIAIWVALAMLAAAGTDGAMDGWSTGSRLCATVIAYALWGAGLVTMLVPRTSSLSVARAVVPTCCAAAITAAGWSHAPTAPSVLLGVSAASAFLLMLAPWSTDAFVNGSSYGPEQRFALRTPVVVALVTIPVWILIPVGALSGPLLLADGRIAPGIAAILFGLPACAFALKALHQLSRRWIVLVPSGMVVHDPLTLPEAQLFLRQSIGRLGPALEPNDALDQELSITTEDLTAGATGLALAIELNEPVDLLVRTKRDAQVRSVDRVLFTPLRATALLKAARAHRLSVG